MTDKVALGGMLAESHPHSKVYTCQKEKAEEGSLHHFSN